MPKDHAARRISPVRDLLRAETRADHERLHRHASFAALFDGTLSLAEYRQLTLRLYGFYLPLDMAIDGALAGFSGGYRHAYRSGFLADDLRDLDFTEAEIAAAPECAGTASLVTPAALAGVLYVIDGATLGGATIDRVAARLLSDDSADGRRYWSWCRSVAPQRWRMMLGFLDRALDGGTTVDEMRTGAVGTFRLLADWLGPLERAQPRIEAGCV